MNPESENSKSAFLPVFLSSAALLIFFLWQLSLIWSQRSALIRVEASQKPVVEKAVQAQTELQGLAAGLLEMAKTDPVAQQIINAYGIAQAAPAAPTKK